MPLRNNPFGSTVFKLILESGSLNDEGFVSPITDYYFTNPIARASATMAACAEAKTQRTAAGAHVDGTGSNG